MPAPSGSTSKYGFPYLLESDAPDIATASQDLAQAVETEIALVANAPGMIVASQYIATPNYNATTGIYQCIDSTNAKLTVVAPPSGKLLLTESTLWNCGTSGEGILLTWSNGTSNNTGLIGSVARTGPISSPVFMTLEHYVSGLTPGTTYTLALQWAYYGSAGGMNAGAGLQVMVLKAIAL